MFALEIVRKIIFGLRESQFWSPRGSFWTTLGAWEMDTCGNLASPRPDPIWGGGTYPKVVTIAERSTPTRGRVPGCARCCTSSSPIPPRHLRWLKHQLQLDLSFGSSFRNLEKLILGTRKEFLGPFQEITKLRKTSSWNEEGISWTVPRNYQT